MVVSNDREVIEDEKAALYIKALDADGQPAPVDQDQQASLTCAMALLSGLQAVDTPPVTLSALPTEPRTITPSAAFDTARPASRHSPKPPATAPPHA